MKTMKPAAAKIALIKAGQAFARAYRRYLSCYRESDGVFSPEFVKWENRAHFALEAMKEAEARMKDLCKFLPLRKGR
jgi:hypothetical protein